MAFDVVASLDRYLLAPVVEVALEVALGFDVLADRVRDLTEVVEHPVVGGDRVGAFELDQRAFEVAVVDVLHAAVEVLMAGGDVAYGGVRLVGARSAVFASGSSLMPFIA